MATTPLKPKSIQYVLAQQTAVVTPPTTPTPVMTAEERKAANKAQLAANQAAAQAKREALWSIDALTWDFMSDIKAVESWSPTAKLSPTLSAASGVNTLGWLQSKVVSVKPTVVWWLKTSVPKTDIGWTTPHRVQVGKLVSDFQNSLKSSKWDKAKYYEGINYNALSEDEKKQADNFFQMREDAKKKLVDKKLWEMDIYDKYKTWLEWTTEEMKAQLEKDRAALEEAAKKEKETLVSDYDTWAAEYEWAFNTFETEQKDLLNNYESNRLNQVQWDIRRALLARGVDISKIPQEQLIALSGQIWAQAFSDISGAKERATNAIENARQNKIAKVRQLKSNKAITESQYDKQIATINSTANQAKKNLDLKLAETVFWIKQAQETKKETTETWVIQAIANMAGYLWLSGTQLKDLYAVAGWAKTVADAVNRITAEVQNTSSPIYSSMKSNQEATQAAADFKNKLEALKVQADLLRAKKSWGSGKSWE